MVTASSAKGLRQKGNRRRAGAAASCGRPEVAGEGSRGARWAACVVCALFAFAPRPADATPEVRDWLKIYVKETQSTPSVWTLSDRPLCHVGSDPTKSYFLDRPFARAFVNETGGVALPRGSRAIIEKALAAIDAQKVDSDCDGFPDLDELRESYEPNEATQHPPGDPPLTPCLDPTPGAVLDPQPGPGGEGDRGEGSRESGGGNGAASAQGSTGGSCSLGPPGRPLDTSALLVAAAVGLSLVRGALRSRERRA
jgi:hypothetical protein